LPPPSLPLPLLMPRLLLVVLVRMGVSGFFAAPAPRLRFSSLLAMGPRNRGGIGCGADEAGGVMVGKADEGNLDDK